MMPTPWNHPIDIVAQPPRQKFAEYAAAFRWGTCVNCHCHFVFHFENEAVTFLYSGRNEAALDDANVRRYAQYLTRFSKETQFIVITHRKGTMEYADVMYGVTMQEKGVSKLISVDFSKAQEDVV